MASSVHSVYPQLPPTYPSHAHSNSMNSSFSQPQMASFEAPNQSSVNTPAPTPPPPRPGSQQHMSYGMNGGHAQMMPPNNYGGAYPEPNMFAQPQYHSNGQSPQIYTVRRFVHIRAPIKANFHRLFTRTYPCSRWRSMAWLSCEEERTAG